jgi:hypothetical protein
MVKRFVKTEKALVKKTKRRYHPVGKRHRKKLVPKSCLRVR